MTRPTRDEIAAAIHSFHFGGAPVEKCLANCWQRADAVLALLDRAHTDATDDLLRAVESLCTGCGGKGWTEEHDPDDPHRDGCCDSCPVQIACNGPAHHIARDLAAALAAPPAPSSTEAAEGGGGVGDHGYDGDWASCPNCITPWKCNGPHAPESAASPSSQVHNYARMPHCPTPETRAWCPACAAPPSSPASDHTGAARTCEHSWRFMGDDPYTECLNCGEIRDALTDILVRPGESAASSDPTAGEQR